MHTLSPTKSFDTYKNNLGLPWILSIWRSLTKQYKIWNRYWFNGPIRIYFKLTGPVLISSLLMPNMCELTVITKNLLVGHLKSLIYNTLYQILGSIGIVKITFSFKYVVVWTSVALFFDDGCRYCKYPQYNCFT